jgi:geranylgeranyl pyrophosphate synthase
MSTTIESGPIDAMTSVDERMLNACSTSALGVNAVSNSVIAAIRHHLSAGGGRVRAHFSLDSSRRLGIDSQSAMTLAAICELLHNASLIHDDLLDRAATRRNAPSVWSMFGDATAVCAGDLMLASAFALVGDLADGANLAPILRLVHLRTRDVILGQGTEQACSPETLEDYRMIAVGKSASLLSLPFELSLLLSGNRQSLVTAQRALEDFAAAYQMLDDLADFREDERNGSLNVVAVALSMGLPDYPSACAVVCSRADALIQDSIDGAKKLPLGCAASMIAYAEKMRLALNSHQRQVMDPIEELPHGR